MRQHTNLTKYIKLRGVIFIVGIVISITALDIYEHYHDFKLNSDRIRADHIAIQKQLIQNEVKHAVDFITYEKEQSEILTKKKIKSRVYDAHSIAQNIYSQNKKAKSKAEIQKMIKDALRPIRFACGSGYFFATSMDGVEILSADHPEIEGLNILDWQDTRQQYVIQKAIKIVKQSGEGFNEYYWSKPYSTGNDYKKISFYKLFEPYDWLIGAGLYVDDIEEQIKENLLSTISRIRFPNEGYLFVNKYDGTVLVARKKVYTDAKKIWEYFTGAKSEQMKEIYDRGIKAALTPLGDFFYYSTERLSAPEQVQKIAFVYSIPDLQWVIGASVYLDEAEKDIAIMQAQLNKEIQAKYIYVFLIALGLISLFLFLFGRFGRRLENDINLFISFFNQAAVSEEVIDRSMIQFEELDRIAENANKMLADRNKAEKEHLHALRETKDIMESVPVAIYMLDLEGKLINWNKAVEDKTGYSKEELKTKTGLELIYPDDIELATDASLEVYQKGSATREIRICTKKGKPVPHLFSGILKKDDEGKIMGMLGVAKDISDLKQLEQQLQQAQKMEAIGLMAGGVAHDLNNILSSIVGYPELMLLKLSSESEMRKPLEAIQDSGERAAAVVADLLTVARGVASAKSVANLNCLVGEYFDSPEYDHLCSLHPELICRKELEENLPNISCSPVHIKKCIMNLMTNSAESLDQSGTITIATSGIIPDLQWCKENGMKQMEYVTLTIEDTGTGIPKNSIAHIFEPFYSKKVLGRSGTGLGLTVVWNTLKEHNGTVTVVSNTQGTSFKLFFPITKEVISLSKSTTADPLQGNGETILVIDDEPTLRDIACSMLDVFGYNVTLANSGEEAVAYLQDHQVDLILLDMLMEPGIGGRETYEQIIKLHPGQKAIIASGFSESDEIKATLQLGADSFIKKPYSMDQLGMAVRDALLS